MGKKTRICGAQAQVPCPGNQGGGRAVVRERTGCKEAESRINQVRYHASRCFNFDLSLSYSRITGLKIRTKDNGDLGTPSLQTESTIRPRERLSLINTAIERDLSGRKERDHGYEDILEVSV